MLFESAFTIDVNAPPMITPTARSITLPRVMNFLNSAKNFFITRTPVYIDFGYIVTPFEIFFNTIRTKNFKKKKIGII